MKKFWMWWAIIATLGLVGYVLYKEGPLPFDDDGHACYEVVDEKAGQALLPVMAFGGLTEQFTFEAGPTRQCLLSDGKTVLMWFDKTQQEAGDTGNARSLVVDDPLGAASRAAMILRDAGYTAQIEEPPMGLGANKLVLLKTNALRSSCLVFRLHAMSLGEPPNQRKISQ